jgi:hypothetical protein
MNPLKIARSGLAKAEGAYGVNAMGVAMYRSSHSEFGIGSTDLDILAYTMRNHVPANSNSPSFLSGWQFLSVIPSDDGEALSIKAVPSADGPMIAYNPSFISAGHLEDPAAAMLWLPIALNHLCTEMLHEADNDGLFASPRWYRFRQLACLHMHMEWEEILASTDLHGTSYMAEALASALFVESGLMDTLMARRDSKTSRLKSA